MDVVLEKSLIKLIVSIKKPQKLFILTIHFVYSDYNFIPEILRQLVRYGTEIVSNMAPKIWSKVPETTKMSSSLETRMRLPPLCSKFATGSFR